MASQAAKKGLGGGLRLPSFLQLGGGMHLPLVMAGVSLLVGALGGWVVRDWKADSDELAEERATLALREKQQDKVDTSAVEYEHVRVIMEPLQTEVRNTIREVYRDRKVPAVCAVTADGHRVLDTAITATNAAIAGKLETGLPADIPTPRPVH